MLEGHMWAIASPRTYPTCVRRTRRAAIKAFTDEWADSKYYVQRHSWRWWRRNLHFSAVKVRVSELSAALDAAKGGG